MSCDVTSGKCRPNSYLDYSALPLDMSDKNHWYYYGSNTNCRCGNIVMAIFFLSLASVTLRNRSSHSFFNLTLSFII